MHPPMRKGERIMNKHHHFSDGIFRGKGSADPCKRCIMKHAAPDLLEALQTLEECVRLGISVESLNTSKNGVMDMARAAIKKAEGE